MTANASLQERRQREEAFFDHLAEAQEDSWWGHRTYAGKRRQVRRAGMIAGILSPVGPHTRLLEIGCGAGDFTLYLMEKLPPCQFVGMDISSRLLAVARHRIQRFGVDFIKGDVQKLDPGIGLFDAVIGASILHHLDLTLVLAEIRKVLKPGGRMVFMEPNMRNPQIWLERNVRFIGKALQNTEDETAFYRHDLARRLRDAGFDSVSVKPFDFLHPLTPKPLVGFADKCLQVVERIPIVNEIAGSLLIQAVKNSKDR